MALSGAHASRTHLASKPCRFHTVAPTRANTPPAVLHRIPSSSRGLRASRRTSHPHFLPTAGAVPGGAPGSAMGSHRPATPFRTSSGLPALRPQRLGLGRDQCYNRYPVDTLRDQEPLTSLLLQFTVDADGRAPLFSGCRRRGPLRFRRKRLLALKYRVRRRRSPRKYVLVEGALTCSFFVLGRARGCTSGWLNVKICWILSCMDILVSISRIQSSRR